MYYCEAPQPKPCPANSAPARSPRCRAGPGASCSCPQDGAAAEQLLPNSSQAPRTYAQTPLDPCSPHISSSSTLLSQISVSPRAGHKLKPKARCLSCRSPRHKAYLSCSWVALQTTWGLRLSQHMNISQAIAQTSAVTSLLWKRVTSNCPYLHAEGTT